jgi:hypothetical protein
MKLIITESKYTLAVKSYLDSLYTPDGGFDKATNYRNMMDKFGAIDFDIDGDGAYEYWSLNKNNNEEDTLWIFGRVSNTLTQTFGANWVDIFVEWFTHNTRLNVGRVYYYINGERHFKDY